jgi:hypothetical protein
LRKVSITVVDTASVGAAEDVGLGDLVVAVDEGEE